MMRVALIDDHPVVRCGMRWLLERSSTITVAAEAHDARSGLQLANQDIHVYCIDISLPDSDGFALTYELLRLAPAARVLILTLHAREEFVVRALRGGATGYALKDQPGAELIAAVECVARGDQYIAPLLQTPRLATLLATRRSVVGPLSVLSRREREVFDLLVRGFSNQELADRLFISVKTVETHRTRIFVKLGIHGIADLIRLAAKEGALLDR
jgi:two-component system, NarL family, response regulator NreC